MKITDVEAMVLDTGKDYPDPNEAAEAHGVRFVALIKITTDEGIVGWSDIETQPHVGRQIVDVPSGGAVGFESIKRALVGEDPLERERLWQKMTRYLAYYGREGAGMQTTRREMLVSLNLSNLQRHFDRPRLPVGGQVERLLIILWQAGV